MSLNNELPLLDTPMGQPRMSKPMVSRASSPLAWEQYDAWRRHWRKLGRAAGKKIALQREILAKEEKDAATQKKLAKKVAENEAKLLVVKAAAAVAAAKPVGLDNSIAGKKGKFGGISPYTDKDVALAKEYLVEMGKNPLECLHNVNGLEPRGAAHMIAEYCGHMNRSLVEEIHKLKMNGVGVQTTALKNRNLELIQRVAELQEQLDQFHKAAKVLPKAEYEQMNYGRKIKEMD